MTDVSPWVPISDPLKLKILGKLIEELNELGSATARCLIQGIDECEPVTGKVNRTWLTEEVADVLANIGIVTGHLGLDQDLIAERAATKMMLLCRWHDMETADLAS